MDKKNTLLLTVIAVATLLVAVVGATFAYFSVVNGSTSSTTTVTGSTPNVGTVSLTEKSQTLKLNVTAEQMSETNKGKYYHATSDGNAIESSSTDASDLKELGVDNEIATITISGGDESAETNYYCQAKLTVNLPDNNEEQNDNTMLTALNQNEVFVRFSQDESNLVSSLVISPIDLKEIRDTYSKNYEQDIKINLTGDSGPVKLYADVYLANTDSEQNHLADKTLKATITVSDLTCDTKPLAGD